MVWCSLALANGWAELELDEERFTDLVAAELEQAAEGCTITGMGPQTLSMECENGAQRVVYLNNLWANWQADPEAREATLANWVHAIVARPAQPSTADPSQLMPVVRGEGFLSAVEPLGTPLYDELTGDYVVFYALDLPDRVQFLSVDDLDELAMSHDEVREHALDNLQTMPVEVIGKGPIYVLSAGGTYEASVLTLTPFWDDLQQHSGTPIVAVAPTRDMVFFTFSERRRVRRRMERTADQLYDQGGYVVSPTLLVWTEDGWQTL